MKLEKAVNRSRGYDILLKMPKGEWSSYWTSPPDSVDHADIKYIKNRYSYVNTKEKMNIFKRLYKNLWIGTTDRQLKEMKHCLGLDYKKKPYRNYMFLNAKDVDWNYLVGKKLAVKGDREPDKNGSIYFHLTRQGIEYVLGKSISDKLYKEL